MGFFLSVESEDLVQQNKVRKIPTMNSQQEEAKQSKAKQVCHARSDDTAAVELGFRKRIRDVVDS